MKLVRKKFFRRIRKIAFIAESILIPLVFLFVIVAFYFLYR